MPSTSKHILLVNFDFPPNHGIGGRRWGKLAKGLALNGFEVHVIKADPVQSNKNSHWTEDVIHPNIHVHSIPRTYPVNFSHPKSGLVGKIKYRLLKFKLMFSEQGTIYDISIGWNKHFEPLAKSLISKFQIVNVIATGAPWNLLFYTCRLKDQFSALHIISDFRDPWLEAKNYGMENLSAQRKKVEAEKQEFVIASSNVVTTPAEEMTNRFKVLYEKKYSTHFELLGHFYDSDDMGITSSTSKNDEIVFVYGGDLYLGIEPQLKKLLEDLETLKISNQDLYSKLEVRIFTDSTIPEFLKSSEVIKTEPSIGKEIFEQIRQSHYCLILLPDNKKHHITTKSIEYLPFRKPFLVYANDGDFTAFVKENNLGYCMYDKLISLDEVLSSSNEFSPDDEMISRKSLEYITAKLISLLK